MTAIIRTCLGKKGKIAVPLITWCWIILNQKIKVHSLGNSYSQVTLARIFRNFNFSLFWNTLKGKLVDFAKIYS